MTEVRCIDERKNQWKVEQAGSFCTKSETKILRAVTKAEGMKGVKRTLKFAGWM